MNVENLILVLVSLRRFDKKDARKKIKWETENLELKVVFFWCFSVRSFIKQLEPKKQASDPLKQLVLARLFAPVVCNEGGGGP